MPDGPPPTVLLAQSLRLRPSIEPEAPKTMRSALLCSALTALFLAATAPAQGMQVYHFDGPRHATNVVLFSAEAAAGVTVVHGQPAWKDEYTGMLGMLKGKTHRLGKDLWTTLMTSAPVDIGGVKVAPGCYCVGLHCDEDGAFSLAMMDATRAMKKGLMPFGPQTWKPELVAPVELNKNALKKPAQKMVMSLTADSKDRTKGTFTIAWGPHTLTAPVAIHAPKK